VTAVPSLSALLTVMGETAPLPSKFQPDKTLMEVWVWALPQAMLKANKANNFPARNFVIFENTLGFIVTD
jgi:hypothetical protein